MTELSTAQAAPEASAEGDSGVAELQKEFSKGAKKPTTTTKEVVAAEVGDPEPSHSMSEDDFLSDDEWETLSKKKRKVKSGDIEEAMSLADMLKNTGLNKSLTTKAQQIAAEKAEAAAAKKEIESERNQIANLFQQLKSDPNAIYELAKNLGHDPDKLAIERAHQRFLYEKMTPEQKRLQALEEENRQFRQMTEAQQHERIQQELSAAEQSVFDQGRQLIDDGIKALGVDADYLHIDRIAQASKYLYEKTGQLPSSDEVATHLRQRFDQEFSGRLGKMTPEEVLSHLPPKIKQGVRELLLRMEAPRVPHGSSQMGSNPNSAKVKKSVGINDYFNNLGK